MSTVDDVASSMGEAGLYRPSYNIAPTHRVPIVREFRERLALGPALWGYPRFGAAAGGASRSGQARTESAGSPTFNARGETAFDKPLFQDNARCLFVMDGWYEWTGVKGSKQPWYTHRKDGKPFVVAGLCKPFDGDVHGTIVTCPAVEPIEWLHHRMPRVLGRDEAFAWLEAPEDDAREIARQAPLDVITPLATREAERAVGGVGNNRPDLIDAHGREEREY